jgi:hypothetical protein
MPKEPIERVAWSISEWAARYGYSRSSGYRIIDSGQGPRLTWFGNGRAMITREDDEAWRRANAERDPEAA